MGRKLGGQLSIGMPFDASADIPMVPPLFLMLLMLTCFLMSTYIKQLPVLPKTLNNKVFRSSAFIAVIAFLYFMITESGKALWSVDSGIAFTPVNGLVTDVWPYTVTRNPLYCGIFFIFPMLSVAGDSIWYTLSMIPAYAYIELIVIPAEEQLLSTQFGKAFSAYCASTPRWLF